MVLPELELAWPGIYSAADRKVLSACLHNNESSHWSYQGVTAVHYIAPCVDSYLSCHVLLSHSYLTLKNQLSTHVDFWDAITGDERSKVNI